MSHGDEPLDINPAPTIADLKAAGRLVVDFPSRKLAIYANPAGQVVLRCWLDGEEFAFVLEPSEIEPACTASRRAGHEAVDIEARNMAAYHQHQTDGVVIDLFSRLKGSR